MTEEHAQSATEPEVATTEAVTEQNTSQERTTAGKPMISYDTFAQLDIAVGTIVSVEVVEGADKLLRLEVDVQEEKPRQIISGIREYFEDPQFLVGKQCPFLLNLEPRVIRGYESQGMILAALCDETFALLIPHNDLPAGTRVQ